MRVMGSSASTFSRSLWRLILLLSLLWLTPHKASQVSRHARATDVSDASVLKATSATKLSIDGKQVESKDERVVGRHLVQESHAPPPIPQPVPTSPPSIPILSPPAPPDPPYLPPNPPLPPFRDPPYVAVGIHVLNIGMDDLYQGYVDIDFLLYIKSFGILSNGKVTERDDAILPSGACAADSLSQKTFNWYTVHEFATPPPPPSVQGLTGAFLVNAYSTPKFEDCPLGAVQAAVLHSSMGVACWRVQGKFTYKVDMVNFPFDTQTFEITLEDESDGFGADYCFLNAVSGLSSEIKNTAEQLTWQFDIHSKCYPPYASCINGTELACTALKRSYNHTKEGSREIECAEWERWGVPDGATKRRQLSMRVAMKFVATKALLRYFLVPFFSLFIMLSTYALDPVENLNPRYTVSAGLLISTILFHVNSVMKATSHTSQLSYFDLMMMITYTVNAVTVQFNVAIFLIDRWITKLDARHNTEAYKSLEHKMYMKSINDTVFGVVIAGTIVGLVGLFTSRSATLGLIVLVIGPPVAGITVHRLQWNLLPAANHSSAPAAAAQSRVQWWHRVWRSLCNYKRGATSDGSNLELDGLNWESGDLQSSVEMRFLAEDTRSGSGSDDEESPSTAPVLLLPASSRDRQSV